MTRGPEEGAKPRERSGPNGASVGTRRSGASAEAVRAFLEQRGSAADVVAGGIEGLIARWESVADAIERGYPLDTLDDYLNDMDARQIIADLLERLPALGSGIAPRLASADARIRARLIPAARCLWGDRIAASHGWSAAREWWYFMRPAKPGSGLARDLGE